MYVLGRILTVIFALVIAIAAICGGYLIYLNVNSPRIDDNQRMATNYRYAEGEGGGTVTPPAMAVGKTYKALTYNIGFGANGQDFSFFMDEGKTVNGDETKGLMSRAKDLKTVKGNIKSVASLLLGQSPDIALFQEVDKDAGRSYRYNEYEEIAKAYGDKAGESDASACDVYATNLHTGWLLYPPTHPIGQIRDSGILTLSRYNIDSAERRSLPVDESFLDKFFDLDRCFTVSRIPVEDAGELVLINVHLSAYDAGLKMRGEQMKVLADVMKAERDKGNWVIAGGDWNQSFPGTIDAFKGRMETPKWATEFDEGTLPEGFSIVTAGNADTVATCRDTSIPWTPGINYETTIDGWVVSDNVSASSLNIDTVYEASDHNPVTLTFTLKS
jgi:endonuclease/exonuclease/phosphatase family metal-dependent hydrolase